MAFIEIKTDIKTYYVECLALSIGEDKISVFFNEFHRMGEMTFKNKSKDLKKPFLYNENLGENLLYIKKDNDYLYKF